MTDQSFDAPLVPAWDEDSIDAVELDASGRIIDFLNPTVTRAATLEERVRQRFARVLVEEYGYAKNCIAEGAGTAHGDER